MLVRRESALPQQRSSHSLSRNASRAETLPAGRASLVYTLFIVVLTGCAACSALARWTTLCWWQATAQMKRLASSSESQPPACTSQPAVCGIECLCCESEALLVAASA